MTVIASNEKPRKVDVIPSEWGPFIDVSDRVNLHPRVCRLASVRREANEGLDERQ